MVKNGVPVVKSLRFGSKTLTPFEVRDKVIIPTFDPTSGKAVYLEVSKELFQMKDKNKETYLEKKLRGKSPGEQYELLYWLMHEFGRAYASSDQAIIDWISGYIKEETNG